MKLNELNNILKQFLDKCEFEVERTDSGHIKFKNSTVIFTKLKKLQALNLFDTNDLKLLNEMNNMSIDNNLQDFIASEALVARWNGFLNSIKTEVKKISKMLSKITQEENPYQINIKLSSEIRYMDDYFVFNNLICELSRDIQALSVEEKAICRLKFNGFEKGSNYIQFIIEAINGINIDELYAYLNKLISIAKEFVIIQGMYLGNKWVKEKIKLTRAQANLTQNQASEKELDNQLRHNFIKEKLSNSEDEISKKIEEKHAEKIILKLIEIIEKQNEIIPSLKAPAYITQDEKNIVNYEKLKEIVGKENRPKQLTTEVSEQKDK